MFIADLFKSRCRLEAENLLLRHQLIIALRRAPVPSENLIRWIRSRKENQLMIETDGDLLQTFARISEELLSFA
jgi:hypothetical protein